MKIKMLEHINIRTRNMEGLKQWYSRILGLEEGYRPPFKAEGMWLYAGDIPMVHLLKYDSGTNCPAPVIEHFCMRAEGLESFLETLKTEGIEYRTLKVPELRILQVYITDPEGNNMHIDFQPEEADKLGIEADENM